MTEKSYERGVIPRILEYLFEKIDQDTSKVLKHCMNVI